MKEQTVINFLFSHNEDKNKLFIEQIITDANKNCIENIKEAQKRLSQKGSLLI